MGSLTAQEFVKKHFQHEEIRGKSIIEVGSLVVDFSVRPRFESFNPAVYKGVDIVQGNGVDEICDAENLLKKYGPETFDILISTEVLEHVRDWKTVVSNFKNILKPGGLLLITTRSAGFDYHGYPYDFWRFEIADMKGIFSDFFINDLEPDPGGPGLFLKATKPEYYRENGLSDIRLYSIVSRKRIKKTSLFELILVRTFYPTILLLKKILRKILPGPARTIVRREILDRIP